MMDRQAPVDLAPGAGLAQQRVGTVSAQCQDSCQALFRNRNGGLHGTTTPKGDPADTEAIDRPDALRVREDRDLRCSTRPFMAPRAIYPSVLWSGWAGVTPYLAAPLLPLTAVAPAGSAAPSGGPGGGSGPLRPGQHAQPVPGAGFVGGHRRL